MPGSYHQHMLQQAQISSSTFIAKAQGSHLDLLTDLWVIGCFLQEHTEINICTKHWDNDIIILSKSYRDIKLGSPLQLYDSRLYLA